MPYDAISKPSPAPSPILDRFRSLIKDRDTEFTVSVGADDGFVSIPPPSTAEIVRFYQDVLSELTFNSKPIITDLTIIAGEQREHCEGIADSVCSRVLQAPVEQKLPSLYLLDSIVKNIGHEYANHFAAHLPEVFCEAYRQVPPNLHASMRHLFGTWWTVFPSSVLRQIEDELQFSPRMNQPSSTIPSIRASESPRPSHGIHVNPKYLEARRQFDNPPITNNVQLARGASDLKISGQKHSIVYDDFESDTGEVVPSNVGAQRFRSTGFGGCTSFPLSADKLPPSVSGQGRPLSPSVEQFAVSKSPGRTFEQTFTSHPDYSYGRRMRGRDEEIGDWQKRLHSDDSYCGFENVASYNFNNGRNNDRPRALIDAYGHDNGHRPLIEKPLGMDSRVVNGVASKTASQSWQNTEEEEFDWEVMSPTLLHSRTSDHTRSSNLHLDSIRAGPGLDSHGSIPSDPNLRSSSWTTSNQIHRLEGCRAVGDARLVQDSADGLLDKSSIPRNENSQITENCHSLGVWKSSPVQDVSGTVRESSSHLPFPGLGVPPSFPDGKSSQGDNYAAVSNVASRLVLSGISFEATTTSVTSTSTGLWPSTSVSSMMPLPSLYPHQQYRSPVDFVNSISAKPMQIQRPAFIPLLNLSRPSVTLQQQLPVSQDLRQSYVPIMSQFPPQIMRPPVSLSYTPLNHGVAASNMTSNATQNLHSSFPIQNVANGFVQMQASVRPLSLGPCLPSQILMSSSSGVNQIPPVGVSGLISSLVAQGVLSLAKQTPIQESIGVEFDADLLKVRHESSIRALYDDLPRQCKTCGLRFKTQEEHSKHMDWHVTKNRISKNRKQNLSRKWFVSASMWLSGAEALGTDSAPGFLPTETVVEKKDDEELVVPADENQTACALCGEAFEDFYSDETEEWMYRGAVYLNVPDGSVVGMDRSQLGPIVHAKCRSDSTAAYS